MSKFNKNIISVLDIGTTKVACLIASITPDNTINIIGIGHQISQGIQAGVITDIQKAENSIRSAVGAAEQMAGINIDRIIVNISGKGQQSHTAKAEINIGGQEITKRSIHRLIAQGCEEFRNNEREVIHCIPIDYTIDDTENITNPEGMFGTTLHSTLHIITAPTNLILNLTNCLAQCHLNVEGYISSPYASAIGCLNSDEKELGTTLIVFGGGSTSFSVFKNGNLIHSHTIPIGGNHITNDIAVGLSTNIESAERAKTLHGNVCTTSKDEHEILDIPKTHDDGSSDIINVQKSMLISIIRPRVDEILELLKETIEQSGYKNFGSKIIITGSACQLDGLADLTSQTLNKQVTIGNTKIIEGMAESTKGPAFSTCVGMILLAAEQKSTKRFNFNNINLLSSNIFGQIIIWLKNNF